MNANAVLAERARELAAAAPNGSLERKAAGRGPVALGTTGTLASAKKVLGAVTSSAVRLSARVLLDELEREYQATPKKERST